MFATVDPHVNNVITAQQNRKKRHEQGTGSLECKEIRKKASERWKGKSMSEGHL